MSGEAKKMNTESPISLTVEEVDSVTRKINVTVPGDHSKQQYGEELGKYKNHATMKGFRKGKAPQAMLEKTYGPRIRADIFEGFIRNALRQAVEDLKLNIIGAPELDITNEKIDSILDGIEFSMNVFLYPDPKIENFDSFEVDVTERKVEDQDVTDVVNRILDSKSTVKVLEDQAAQNGLLVSAKMKLLDEETAAEEPFFTTVGDKKVPEDLENALVGMKAGDTKDVKVSFPEDHQNQALRGQTKEYRVTVEKVSEKVLPELTDAFVKALGFDGVETVMELRLDISKRLEEENEQHKQQDVRSAILEQLLERNPFEIPQILIDEEIRGLLVGNGFVDPQKVDVRKINVASFRDFMGPEAKKRVGITVAIDVLIKAMGLEATADDVDAHINKLSEAHGMPADQVRGYLMAGERAQATYLDVARDKVLAELEKRAKVSFKAAETAEK